MALYPCLGMKKETIFTGTSSSTLTRNLNWNASSKPTFTLSKSVYNYDFIIIRYGIGLVSTNSRQCSHELWLDVEEIRRMISFNTSLSSPNGAFTDAMVAAVNYNNTGTTYAYAPVFKFTDDTHVALNQASMSGWNTEQPYLYEIIGIKL